MRQSSPPGPCLQTGACCHDRCVQGILFQRDRLKGSADIPTPPAAPGSNVARLSAPADWQDRPGLPQDEAAVSCHQSGMGSLAAMPPQRTMA